MKVFLSSTYIDLVDHRRAATDAIDRLGQQVGRMEVFGARPSEPSEACFSAIEECDLFVGLYAHRYGFVPSGSRESITEAELNHARANGKPSFCFVVDDDHPWPPKLIEGEPGKSWLRQLKMRLDVEVVRETFTTPQDLAYRIAAALGRHLAVSSAQPMGHGGTWTDGELFDRILSEMAALRMELRGQKDLLMKVNRIGTLLQPSVEEPALIVPLLNGPDLVGRWRDSYSQSTFYGRFIGNELIVPYCYGGDSRLTGAFFNFRMRSETVFFARFRWFDAPIHGFAYLERRGPNDSHGGWWYSLDVPRDVLGDLSKLGPRLPRMNDFQLVRIPDADKSPMWVDRFFASLPAGLLHRLDA
jgi:hypothetical protein